MLRKRAVDQHSLHKHPELVSVGSDVDILARSLNRLPHEDDRTLECIGRRSSLENIQVRVELYRRFLVRLPEP